MPSYHQSVKRPSGIFPLNSQIAMAHLTFLSHSLDTPSSAQVLTLLPEQSLFNAVLSSYDTQLFWVSVKPF